MPALDMELSLEEFSARIAERRARRGVATTTVPAAAAVPTLPPPPPSQPAEGDEARAIRLAERNPSDLTPEERRLVKQHAARAMRAMAQESRDAEIGM